ncbi:AraC family transcriptional regulator [Dyadobacter pollutisoli]|uniref:Helix-turn-helix domain-containing protein n=1 Tax=Dyadobacter pollutisoli TaxID=2910158 RepID=A0A9E8NEZ3_9BACT|nr:helix-turn-helix domain-containing protein [Dyadobacter pollutisoli]WAC13077.1 helix-turn-helix domain-containing protein [Dyadobacter pollutisoli]
MQVQYLLPSLRLSPLVNGILVIRYEGAPEFTLPLFANGSPVIIFQTTAAKTRVGKVGHLTLYGQTIRPDELLIAGNFTLIAWFLQPHTLKPLLQTGARQLTDDCIDISYFRQAREKSLEERLLNTSDLIKQLQLMEEFLTGLPSMDENDIERVNFAVAQIKNSRGLYSLTTLQDELNVTERTMQRLFENNVGMSAKLFRRVCQFDAAFQQLNQLQFDKLSDVAFEHGYADQSHFTRVFREFTGLTPKEYLARRQQYTPVF